jgi:hypothetical protein
MKNLTLITLCIVPCILYNTNILSINSLSFFMRPYPDFDLQGAAAIVSKKIQKPGKLTKYMASSFDGNIVSGIFSSYAGFLTASDQNGQTSFPLRHSKLVTYYLVTPEVFPVIMFGNTVHHWELISKQPANLYKIEKKKDEELDEYYWEVTQMQLPKDKKISKKAVIIFANPHKVYIPEGITPTSDSSQLILPDIYIKKSISKIPEALYVLTIRQFFAPPAKGYQHESLKHIVQMTEW